ncbi:hypothetical protein MATL_G00022430 [Megalops atlanticus]|uniref:Uncharacterized protein n=1 Tax=Megalops atlanticus TaxID=7932 RepID=A0A9D3QBD2_MEGAT|nr:hypothetical protein MATL_G00022430 [Megalops atlanticus]
MSHQNNFNEPWYIFDKLERPDSPVSSCPSAKSERSREHPLNFTGHISDKQRGQLQRADSPVHSYQSVESDKSMEAPLRFGGGTFPSSGRVQLKRSESVKPSSMSSKDHQMDLSSIFKMLYKLIKKELKNLQSDLSQDYPECFESRLEDPDVRDEVYKMLES